MPLCKVIKEYKKLYRLYGRTGLKRETITFSDSKGLDLKEVIPNCVSDKLSIVARRIKVEDFYPAVNKMLFLWVKILHQNIFSLQFACKYSLFLKIQYQNIFSENNFNCERKYMIWFHSYRYKCDLEYFRICLRDRTFNLKRGWEGVMLWFFPKKYFDAEFSRKNSNKI
jgi:hypothetical protein